MASVVAAFFLVLVAVFIRAFHVTGLPTSKGLGPRLAAEVTVWLVSTLQVLLQLTRTPTPGLPEWLRHVFAFLQALEIDMSGLAPPGCSSGISAFAMAQVLCTACLVGTAGFVVLGCVHLRTRPGTWGKRPGRSDPGDAAVTGGTASDVAPGTATADAPLRPVWGWLQFATCLTAILLYGPALAKGMETVTCIPVQTTVNEQIDGVTYVYTQHILAWAADTSVRCYEGEHLVTAILAWSALLLAGMGLPASLYCLGSLHLRRILHPEMGAGASHAGASHKELKEAARHAKPWTHGRRHRIGRILCQTLPERLHADLRQQRPWVTIYGYGQPWLRPTSLAVTLLTSLLSSLLPADVYPIARGLTLGVLLVTAAAVCVWPSITLDHHWSAWKRWPRAVVYVAGGALVALQCALALSAHEATPLVATLSWAVAVAAASLPLALVASLFVWLTRMISCLAFWRCCPCSHGCCGASRWGKKRGEALSSMLSFTMSFGSERAVRSLVHQAGRSSVVLAMASPNPASAMRSLRAVAAVTTVAGMGTGTATPEDPLGGWGVPGGRRAAPPPASASPLAGAAAAATANQDDGPVSSSITEAADSYMTAAAGETVNSLWASATNNPFIAASIAILAVAAPWCTGIHCSACSRVHPPRQDRAAQRPMESPEPQHLRHHCRSHPRILKVIPKGEEDGG